MDWDDIKPQTTKAWAVGEDLGTASIGELEERIAALEAEIARVRTEIDAKRRQAAAAAALFGS
jgi:uncharacterized small protein (DUF1192 family)